MSQRRKAHLGLFSFALTLLACFATLIIGGLTSTSTGTSTLHNSPSQPTATTPNSLPAAIAAQNH